MLIFGIDPLKFFRTIIGLPKFLKDFYLFRSEEDIEGFRALPNYPVLHEYKENAGSIAIHYFLQDLYIAQLIFRERPVRHLDIGSRVDGFVTHIASFREVEVMDIRDAKLTNKNIIFKKVDIMNLKQYTLELYDSISCLHALEHFGLGRYGDQIDYYGHLRGLNNIFELLSPVGKLYLSVPIGKQRIEFNAHRVFSIEYLKKVLFLKFSLERFSYIDDDGNLHQDIDLMSSEAIDNFNCNYGCGIFILRKMV